MGIDGPNTSIHGHVQNISAEGGTFGDREQFSNHDEWVDSVVGLRKIAGGDAEVAL